MQVQISGLKDQKLPKFALFNLGFRPFFLGAALFSVVSVSFWSIIYLFHFSIPLTNITSSQWHSHEMIYGYSLAVIAGFLLTAVKNWTGVQTVSGRALMLLFSLWLAARLLLFAGTSLLLPAAVFDLLFVLALAVCVAYPIFKAQQWKQLPILALLVLFAVGNGLFYLGAFALVEQGVALGIYLGLYLVVAMILVMGRRVVPFFIEKGVGYAVEIHSAKWVDVSILCLFALLVITELFVSLSALSMLLSLGLFVLCVIRLFAWHTVGIWKKCLLWSLYLAFCFIALGFLLIASHYLFATPLSLAMHAFTYGGIGVITLGMMARVAYGHTGRNVHEPPHAMNYALGLLVAGAVVRVFLPLLETDHYQVWIGASQLLWLSAFLIFLIVYLPILMRPRVDGMFG